MSLAGGLSRQGVGTLMDRPILFSSPMVRALLDGRKTQTRRVLKPQPFDPFLCNGAWFDHQGTLEYPMRGPSYAVGGRLWVKERLSRSPDLWKYVADDSEVGWPARRELAAKRLDYAPS